MAICGSSCTIDVGGALTDAFQFTLDWQTQENDVRTFGSATEFGDWIACADSGNLTVQSYSPIATQPGDTATYSANCGAVVLSGNCSCMTLNVNADAKGLVTYSSSFRLTGDVSVV